MAEVVLYEIIRIMKNLSILLLFFAFLQSNIAQDSSLTLERWQLVESYLDQQKDFSGIVMTGSGTVLFSKGYGYADRAQKIPYSDQTLFTIGSITKPFTATAILLLMEQGKLSPKQPVTDFFENVPLDKHGITIHHLLTHSSGLPGAIGDDYEALGTLDFQKRLWERPLVFKPGEGYEYSNTGYSLLGMIIEKLSGESYNDFLRKNIFSKAGMITAGYTNPYADYSRLAHGYLPDGSDSGTSKARLWDGDEPYWNLKANGGLLMSATDMYHWYLALRDKKILTPASLTLQLTPYVDEGQGSFYGYGYALDGVSVQHNGGNRIFKADFRWFPGSDMFFFSATNDANVRLFRINDEIVQILRTGVLPAVLTWTPLLQADLAKDARNEIVSSFMDMLHLYSPQKAEKFIDRFCSPGIIERNGRDKLIRIFEMLSTDSNQGQAEKILSSAPHMQLLYPSTQGNARLKIILFLSDNKLERLNAEFESL